MRRAKQHISLWEQNICRSEEAQLNQQGMNPKSGVSSFASRQTDTYVRE